MSQQGHLGYLEIREELLDIPKMPQDVSCTPTFIIGNALSEIHQTSLRAIRLFQSSAGVAGKVRG